MSPEPEPARGPLSRALSAGVRGLHRVFIALGWCVVVAVLALGLLDVLAAMPPTPSAQPFAGKVFAHRAQASGAPENTLAGMRAAHAAGATGLEVDVHLTKDGHAVLLHDATVNRTTDGRGPIAELTLEQARFLAIRGGGGAHAGQRIPTLDEAVELAGALGLPLELDVKRVDEDVVAERIAEVLSREAAFDRVFVSSFYPDVLRAVRSREPRVVTALAVRPDATGIVLADRFLLSLWLPRWLGVGLIEPHRGLVSSRQVDAWRASGFVVNVWTVNSAADKAWLRSLGVSYTTNCPGTTCPDDPSDQM